VFNPGKERQMKQHLKKHLKKHTQTWAALATLAALAGPAQAALVSLGDGTVKDTLTNLIWLQDWNVNGLANWSTQKAWAEGLDFAGRTDWELPESADYEALFAAYGDLTQVNAFTDVQSSDLYWTSTRVTVHGDARLFDPVNGYHFLDFERSPFFAVAVRPGDVTAAVPEPQTLALSLVALGAAAWVRRSGRRPCNRLHDRPGQG
jgi:hypothetical protein